MSGKTPHYLLFSDGGSSRNASVGGSWHFVLETLDGSDCTDVSDEEPNVSGERLELLAVVRGLEALNQPSRVTLVTPSRYVARGIRFGLDEWRASDWKWERHGWMVPVKNADLWRRVDQAMQYHQLQCRRWRVDRAHDIEEPQSNLKPIERQETEAASVRELPGTSKPHRHIGAARSIVQTVRDGVAAAVKASDRACDFGAPNWSLAQ